MNRYFLLKLLKLKNGILTFEGKKTTDQSQVSVVCSHICHSVNSKLNLSRKVSHTKTKEDKQRNTERAKALGGGGGDSGFLPFPASHSQTPAGPSPPQTPQCWGAQAGLGLPSVAVCSPNDLQELSSVKLEKMRVGNPQTKNVLLSVQQDHSPGQSRNPSTHQTVGIPPCHLDKQHLHHHLVASIKNQDTPFTSLFSPSSPPFTHEQVLWA